MQTNIDCLDTEIPFVLSVAQLAQLLKIGRNAAYALVQSGKIKSVRVGKTIRIPRSAVYRYLQCDPISQN